MSAWQSCHIFYGEVDRLIAECVHPFLREREVVLERRFWERHYAGGPQLRVRVRGEAGVVDRVAAALERAALSFVTAHPTAAMRNYSERRAAALLEREGGNSDEEDLRYRNNVVERHRYPEPRRAYVSEDAAALAEDFRHDAMDLAVRIITDERPRSEALLRLYFLQALFVGGGDLLRGAVSSKSHWEGFASTFPSAELLDRVRDTYARTRERIRALMLDVTHRYDGGAVEADPVLGAWWTLLDRYRRRTREILASGKQVTAQPSTPEQAARLYEDLRKIMVRDSVFVRTLWSNAAFLATIQYDPAFLIPRVLTNLLYILAASVGINPVDRMALCYFSHRIVEQHFGCDLTDRLEETMSASLARHGHRWDR